MNTVLEPEKKSITHRAIVPALMFIILSLIILYPGGMYLHHRQALAHFITLLEKDECRAAVVYWGKSDSGLASFTPGFISARDNQQIQARLEIWTGEYLAGHLNREKLTARINVLKNLGLVPEKLDLYQQALRAEELADSYALSNAIGVTEKALKTYPNDPMLMALQESYWNRLQHTVVYPGPVQHIFFHPLIAYPERAFDGDYQSRGFNEYFVTIPEFKRIIAALYRNDFVLIDYNDIVEADPVNGILNFKTIRLPAGKKPLILSIDDLNYYPYMLANGMVSRLVLDKDGQVAAATVNDDHTTTISYDNEIIPILDGFVRQHPDFSYQGAKGIIALTGYEGVLGYRTNDRNSPNYTNEEKQARAVIKQLKATGWSFASHGYGHLDAKKASLPRLMADTAKWQAEVGTLVGPTNIYIFPYGSRVDPGDIRFKYLQQAGFKIFCPVGSGPYVRSSPQFLIMDRRHIDGISLLTQANLIRDLFDSEPIVDPIRPRL